jgi:hypothetical protein
VGVANFFTRTKNHWQDADCIIAARAMFEQIYLNDDIINSLFASPDSMNTSFIYPYGFMR